MIRFPCYCGHQFALDDSEAARLVQCPDCGKLNDVPTHQDLAHLDEQGVLKLKPVEIDEEPERLERLSKIYAKSRQDEEGNDIDFRQKPEDFVRRGTPSAREPAPVHRPRYDPESGELVRPIEVTPEPPRKALPVELPALHYARPDTPNNDPLSLKQLLQPGNLFSMTFVVLLMLFAGLFAILVYIPFPNAAGGPPSHMLVMVGPLIICELLALAHYGNVIEELGPLYRDELPRMFGDVHLYENVFAPLRAVIDSVLLCYAPAVLVFNLKVPMLAVPVGSLLVGAGTYFFPAVLLTLTTSGTPANLRPDRIWGTITACGTSYLWCVFGWTVAGAVYLWAYLHFLFPLMGQLQPIVDYLPPMMTMLFALPVIHVLTVPFAHIFAWQTGMLYRRSYDEFPWVGQRHVKEPVEAKKV